MTTYDIEQHLARKQIEHYTLLKQATAATGDKQEYRRAIDMIDQIATRNGIHINKRVIS